MKKQKSKISLAFASMVLVFLIVGLAFANQSEPSGKVLGGTDEHGCIPTANYVWSETEQKCVVGGHSEEIPPIVMPTVSILYIYTDDQSTTSGTATYKVVINDPHKISDCGDGEPESDIEVACSLQSYEYKLEFKAQEGISGTFDQNEFHLGAGQSKVVTLTVTAEKEGTYKFSVLAKSDFEAKAYGIIIYLKHPENSEDTSLFVGKGFLINSEESKGLLADFTILNKDNVLSGKATINKETYKIKGSLLVSDAIEVLKTNLKFDLISLKSGEVVGSFSGAIKNFGSFKLMKGELSDFNGENWVLTATSKEKTEIRETDTEGDTEPISVRIDDFVSVEGKSTTRQAVYSGSTAGSAETSDTTGVTETNGFLIKPVSIESKKILWIIPTGSKVVNVEIIKGDKVVKKTISENGETSVEGYKISVGALDDEENIGIKVTKD